MSREPKLSLRNKLSDAFTADVVRISVYIAVFDTNEAELYVD